MPKPNTVDNDNVSKSSKSIDHALKTLDEAAKESSQEFRALVNRDYTELKRVLAEARPEVREALQELGAASYASISRAKERVSESTRQVAQTVDESVHDKPWIYIGGAAVVGAVVGFALSRRGGR